MQGLQRHDGTAGADSCLAYICDYKKGEINYQVLGREAKFCFTTTMNGCTFGIGSPTSDGSVLVSHANMATPLVPTVETKASGAGLVPTGDQAERQLAVARAWAKLSDTRHEHANVTLVGGRSSTGTWKCFYQRWAMAGSGNVTLLSCNEVTTTKAHVLTRGAETSSHRQARACRAHQWIDDQAAPAAGRAWHATGVEVPALTAGRPGLTRRNNSTRSGRAGPDRRRT